MPKKTKGKVKKNKMAVSLLDRTTLTKDTSITTDAIAWQNKAVGVKVILNPALLTWTKEQGSKLRLIVQHSFDNGTTWTDWFGKPPGSGFASGNKTAKDEMPWMMHELGSHAVMENGQPTFEDGKQVIVRNDTPTHIRVIMKNDGEVTDCGVDIEWL